MAFIVWTFLVAPKRLFWHLYESKKSSHKIIFRRIRLLSKTIFAAGKIVPFSKIFDTLNVAIFVAILPRV